MFGVIVKKYTYMVIILVLVCMYYLSIDLKLIIKS